MLYSPLNVANWPRTHFIPVAKGRMITVVDSDENERTFLSVNFKLLSTTLEQQIKTRVLTETCNSLRIPI